MISIASNFASQTTINQINSSNNALTSSMERLSTGNRINSAADDAAGLQIANRLSTQSRGMSVAMRNSQDATSLLQTAEGSLEELGNIGARMNNLATQAANETNSAADLTALDGEYQALGAEMANILENTNFGGQKLLSGGAGLADATNGITFQTGSTAAETMNVKVDLSSVSDFVSGLGDLTSTANAQTAMKALAGSPGSAAIPESSPGAGDDVAAVPATGGFLQDVTALRSELGSNINRIEHNIANMTQMKENLDASTGRIMDTDFASESGEMSKQQMLVQTGAKMLSTTKMVPQLAMSMLG